MGGVIDDVISFIGRPFGIYTHDEVFTDIQCTNLLTPGAAEDSARRTAKHASGGIAMDYFNGYRQFQRDYRKKYSAQFMERQGYAPSSTAEAVVLTEAKVKSYIELLYSYGEINVVSFGDKFLTLAEKGQHAVQQIAGYDFPTGQIISSGKVYNSHQYLELSDDTKLEVTSTRLYDDTIIQNLTDNYGYDGTYIYIGDNKYQVGVISSTINVSDEYETVCTHIPHQYADITASALINGTDTCTISYPDDVDGDGYVEDYEIVNNIVNIVITLPITAIVGDSLDVTIDGIISNYVVTQDMIDNGLIIPYSGYTLVSMPTLPDETILTSIEQIVNVVTEAGYGTEASYASYKVISGEVGTETRYWVDVANTQDIYDTTILDITAIIPMKENNTMVDTDAYKLNRMLRKLNLSGEQLKTSIENPDMDSAYLMMGITPEYDDDITNEVLFKMFDYIAPGSGNINIALSQLSMTYSFTMTRRTFSGVIGDVGSYVRTQTGTGIGVVLTLKYQGDANEYQEIVITNFQQDYVISGNAFTAYLSSTGGLCRLVIPLDLINRLPYKKFVWIYERSLCMLAYSMEVVEVKWYETGAFGTLLKIVGVVLSVFTFGAASSLYTVVVAALNMVVIGAVVSLIAEQIGGVAGALLGVIVGTLLAGGFSSFDLTSLTNTEVWLKTANQFLSTMSQIQQMELEEFITTSQEELNSLSEKIEDINNLMREFDDSGIVMSMMSFESNDAGSVNKIYQTTEQYCSGILNTSVDYVSDYGAQIEYAISTRNSIVSGIG
jgi:hypothetical protein